MRARVSLGVLAGLAALAVSGLAAAETPAPKRSSGFLENLFGGERASNPDGGTAKRRQINRRAERDSLFGAFSRDRRTPRVVVSDADPEPDPGLGMGNLTYVPPKLVGLSGLTLGAPRPMGAAEAAIYDALAGEGASLRVLPAARDALLAHYAAQGFKPVWLKDGKLSERGAAVLALLAAADQDGLDPRTYLPSGLEAYTARLPEHDPAAMARLDIDLSGAALRYARDASGGQFDPRGLSRYNDIDPPWIAPGEALKVIAWSPYAADYLKSLQPSHPAYAAMKTALAELRARETGPGFAPIPAGPVVKPGGIDPRIPALRARLTSLGYEAEPPFGSDPALLDEPLSEELRRFQQAAGIKMTGAFGPQTLGALNKGSSASNIDRLRDNMERLRWLPRELGRKYVFVNQPAFEAKVIEDGRQVWATRVIVGKPNTQTVSFHDEMELVVFNPSWGVPPSIIAGEYLPKLRRDPAYLDRMGFKVVNQQGKVVPSRSVNWAAYGRKVPYGIHQPPGEKNALGEVKFLFPNRHNIYMHDTPARELFEDEVRAFSHGCVRVQNPREFAAVVLGWNAGEVAAHIASKGSETIKLKTKLPVYIAYFTAWPDSAGNMRYFNDIYGRDKAMETARSATVVAQN
ncbi:MAG: murein L,D-transpeptidase [Aestuariivirga sp.]|uniref:L,D-transpeptidase family protein n=1 Tax=Aestuariivirga sp. TaxID=2650926 RepID=UPI0038D21594